MHLKTILNAVEKHRLFVYEKCVLVREANQRKRIEIQVRERQGSLAICSGCEQPTPG